MYMVQIHSPDTSWTFIHINLWKMLFELAGPKKQKEARNGPINNKLPFRMWIDEPSGKIFFIYILKVILFKIELANNKKIAMSIWIFCYVFTSNHQFKNWACCHLQSLIRKNGWYGDQGNGIEDWVEQLITLPYIEVSFNAT